MLQDRIAAFRIYQREKSVKYAPIDGLFLFFCFLEILLISLILSKKSSHPSHLLGIDLGGTKIEAALVDSNSPGHAVCRLRIPTEQEKGYAHILSQIKKLCMLVESHSGIPIPESIGFGTPGVIDPVAQTLRGSNTQCLLGKPLKTDLEQCLERSCEISNDANCFALAEATLGAAQGYESVFGIIMGTGTGAGLVVNGRVLSGCHGIAGEWGQIVLDPNGPSSVYGTRGTIEAYLSGPALERFYRDLSGQTKALQEIAAEAKSAPATSPAGQTIEQLTERFAQALAIVINLFDPHAIVIGGGVGNIDALYSESTRQKISNRIFAPTFEAALLKPLLGDSAGVFGAALLTLRNRHER